MDATGQFVARLIDSGLRAYAAATVLREREELRARGVEPEADSFDVKVADTEARLLHLGEAAAAGRPALFLEYLEWSRSTYQAREIPDELLKLHMTCLSQELREELPPAAGSAIDGLLTQALALFNEPPRPIPTVLDGTGPHVELLKQLLLAILEGRRDDALDLLMKASEDGVSNEELELDVLMPLQQEVGRMWQAGEVNIHEEHLGSQIVEEALVLLGNKRRGDGSNDRTVLVSSVTGNMHDLGARVVAGRFQADGWNALRLGSSLPYEDIVRAAVDFRADLIALSVTMSLHVRSTAAVIEHLRSELGAEVPPVLVGGPPFGLVPDLWKVVGADATAPDVREAPAVGRRLIGATV